MPNLIFILFLVLQLISCKTLDSNTFANISPKKEIQNHFLGQLEAFLQKKNVKPFANKVCIEAAPKNSKVDQKEYERKILFEVKLAFAMWFNASSRHGDKTWKHLNFVTNETCNSNDLSFIALNLICI